MVDTIWDVNDPDCAAFLQDTMVCTHDVALWQDAAGTEYRDTLYYGCAMSPVEPLSLTDIQVDTARMAMSLTYGRVGLIGIPGCVTEAGVLYEAPQKTDSRLVSLNVGPKAAVQPTEALFNYGIPDKQAIADAMDSLGDWEANRGEFLGVDQVDFLADWTVRRAGVDLDFSANLPGIASIYRQFGDYTWWGACDSITQGVTPSVDYFRWTRYVGRHDWEGAFYLVTDGASLLPGDTLSWGIEMTNYWGRRDTVRIESVVVPTDCNP